MRSGSRIGAMLVAGAIGLFGVLEPGRAEAYWYGGYYGGYVARPYYWGPPAYYSPYYRPQVVFVPPPVYVEPPPAPVYAPPRVTRPVRRARAAAPARDVCRLPNVDGTSPFAGAGEGATPAAASGAEPLLGPLPGAPATTGDGATRRSLPPLR